MKGEDYVLEVPGGGEGWGAYNQDALLTCMKLSKDSKILLGEKKSLHWKGVQRLLKTTSIQCRSFLFSIP